VQKHYGGHLRVQFFDVKVSACRALRNFPPLEREKKEVVGGNMGIPCPTRDGGSCLFWIIPVGFVSSVLPVGRCCLALCLACTNPVDERKTASMLPLQSVATINSSSAVGVRFRARALLYPRAVPRSTVELNETFWKINQQC